MNALARMLMAAGVLLFLAGAAVYLASKTGLPFGKLPGDFSWEGKNVKVYAPFATMLLVSVILTLLLNLISKFTK